MSPVLNFRTNNLFSKGSGSGSGSESDGSQRSEEEDDGVSFMAYLSLQKSLKTVTDQRIKVMFIFNYVYSFFSFFLTFSLHFFVPISNLWLNMLQHIGTNTICICMMSTFATPA